MCPECNDALSSRKISKTRSNSRTLCLDTTGGTVPQGSRTGTVRIEECCVHDLLVVSV